MSSLPDLSAVLPKTVDARESTVSVALILSLLMLLLIFPTGELSKNEEYYFQVAAQFWADDVNDFSAIRERSRHLFLSAIVIGLPVQWLGYEAASILLRVLTAIALGIGFAHLAVAWRLSALDAVLAVSIFDLLDQQYFGGEWIFRSVEAKVFAYVFVAWGLSQAFRGAWQTAVIGMIIATYFHFLVGGFWILAVLAWLLLERGGARTALRAASTYAIAVLPLAALILWQRIGAGAQDSAIDTWHAYAVLRMAHHIAPFSDRLMIWSWTPQITFLLGTLVASVLARKFEVELMVRRLLWLLIGLQGYLILALLVSATEVGARALGAFYLFRPSSLTLLLVISAIFIVYRQREASRLPVWMAAWILVPIVAWSAVKTKVEEMIREPIGRAEMGAMVDAVTRSTTGEEVVLVQPGRDAKHPEVMFSRLLPRPTLVSWEFAPTLPAEIEEWVRRQDFRLYIFDKGCDRTMNYPIGALIVYNENMPAPATIESCGRVVWRGTDYSVIDVG